MKVQILGTGCSRCKKLIKNAEKAAEKISEKIEEEITIEKIDDLTEIAGMGVMTTPGFAINGEIVESGKVLSKDRIIELIENYKSDEIR
ncbi:MAG: thioredoxin family protein [Candidatus Mcinerneyibacterium aminivorans]|uniref:Thioredoxin family protein n=1 Tax=Candidatus Mcinerneyibacterium aminivorans TaxID=2703815 RepID=A0A5D0MG36_9BACT|nr:MAG: thioredoxin family protein [Candidatus Mcinerneyibacterium aminivorans]